jgi:hypothetical protein
MGRGLANALRRCSACGQTLAADTHANARYCNTCREHRRHYPPCPRTLTPELAAAIRPLLGRVPRAEIERQFGLSKVAIYRYLREQGLQVKRYNAPEPALVEAVLRTYEQGGKSLVRECFPEVNFRSVIERYKDYAPRQIRWTGPQLIEAARMAGLVRHAAQARWFGRPNAYGGSIKSLWAKVFRCAEGDVNGIGAHLAWPLALPGTPATLVYYRGAGGARPLVLWLDLRASLRPHVDPAIRAAIEALARFQAWLHTTERSEAIRAMIQQREGVNDGTG